MALAIILFLLLVGSVIFNFVNPWHATPVASNWETIDTTIVITAVITGIFFIAITLFVIYALIKYRHREPSGDGTHQSSYAPDNKKLEWSLIVITTIGICGLLGPGLVVYNDFVHVPEQADVVEVMGKQWMWSFRLPGKDGQLGNAEVKNINAKNPFGINPADPNGQDDLLVNSNVLYLPIDRPVHMLLRSLDVLHNFYVPQFRSKMDMVPGQVSYFWFTPTVEGEYEVLCAEYCGVAHYNMKGRVIVVDADSYQQWLSKLPTFAATMTAVGGVDTVVEQGRQLAESNGCFACHSVDGSSSLGPGWKGLIGKTEILVDGSVVVADDEYFKRSVLAPNEQIVKGFAPVMAPYNFSDEQLATLISYVRSLDQAVVIKAQQGADESAGDMVERGRQVAQSLGCITCHSTDGSPSLGPSWFGMYGRSETLTDGSTVIVDDDYIVESISNPAGKLVKGYPPIMQPYQLDSQQLDALLALSRSLAK